MAALNQDETNKLALAERAMNDSVVRLSRASAALEGDVKVEMDLSEVLFMISSLKKAERLVNTVKQMKGYYPK